MPVVYFYCTYRYFAWMCVSAPHVPGFCGGQKSALDALELELQTVHSSGVGAGSLYEQRS